MPLTPEKKRFQKPLINSESYTNHSSIGIKRGWPEPKIRTVLSKLLDQHRLVGRALGRRKADDAWVVQMNQTINKSTQEQAADAIAAALAEGMDPEAVGEAISLAANQLVLRSTSSRTHGNSLGGHRSDATGSNQRRWRAHVGPRQRARHTADDQIDQVRAGSAALAEGMDPEAVGRRIPLPLRR
ncbi:MAG: hypothetical protein CMJ64_12545 [Planctomycetaceae bacterium]|nr:hypothetical protein [Planctomycetaceae bacterium]